MIASYSGNTHGWGHQRIARPITKAIPQNKIYYGTQLKRISIFRHPYKTTELFSVARSIVSKVMSVFEKDGKSSALKEKTKRKRKLSDKDRQTLMGIVRKDHKNTVPKITAELNDHLENHCFLKNEELCKAGFQGKTAIRKPYQNKCLKVPLFSPTAIYIYIYINSPNTLYIYIYIYICVCVCVCVCVCIYIR